MRLTLLLLSSFIAFSSSGKTEDSTFEQRFQKIGKKLDEAKAKGQELGAEAKKELQELKVTAEKQAEVAKKEGKEAKDDWGYRFKSAFSELGSGIKNAWQKLKGDE